MYLKSKKNIKKVVLFSLSMLIFTFAFAQADQQKSDFWQHVRFGGGIGLSAGSNAFSASLSPSAIYDFDSPFALGVALNGTYYSQKDFYKSTILGASLLGYYNPIPQIQLSTEFEENHVSRNFDNPVFSDDNFWVSGLFVGAGYSSRNVTIGIRYDLLFDESKSIYADAWVPFVRVYF